MSGLSELIRQRRTSGQGVLSSLGGSLKERLKEKIDPRRIFKQDGVLTALFPGLRAYDASNKKLSVNLTKNNDELKIIRINTKIAAKNSSALTEIARDVNVSSKNLIKFIKLIGKEKPATSADMFFRQQRERESLFEEQHKKESKIEKTSNKKKKRTGLLSILGAVGLAGLGFLIVDFLSKGGDSFMSKLYDRVETKLKESFQTFKTYITDTVINSIQQKWNSIMDSTIKFKDEIIDDVTKTLSIDYLISLFKKEQGDESLIDSFNKKLETYKSQMKGKMDEFSIIPEASAATLQQAPTSPLSTTKKSEETPNLPSVSPTQQPTGIKALMEQIALGEGTTDVQAQKRGIRSGYDVPFGYGKYLMPPKPLTEMTIGEVKAYQDNLIKATKGKVYIDRPDLGTSAVGKYQILKRTLESLQKRLGLKDSDMFDARNQDRMGLELLKDAKLESFMSNKISARQFQNNIARIWASVANFESGESIYGQPTGTSSKKIQNILQNIKQSETMSSLSQDINLQQKLPKTKTVAMLLQKQNTVIVNRPKGVQNSRDPIQDMINNVA